MAGNDDLAPFLGRWRFDETQNVRLIRGLDGREKLQVRLPLGIEQYEVNGRPDGLRPHGKESYLEYFSETLEVHRKKNASDTGFLLTPADCQLLIDEGVLYYYRYVLFFQIGDFSRCIRDTARNLRLFDFIREHAETEENRGALDQYRPFVLRMNRSALALDAAKRGAFDEAQSYLHTAIREISELTDMEDPNFQFERRRSLSVLRQMQKDLRAQRPMSRKELLMKRLARAVRDENYELAARLRDRIKGLKEK